MDTPRKLIGQIMRSTRTFMSNYAVYETQSELDDWTAWTAYLDELLEIEKKTAMLCDKLHEDQIGAEGSTNESDDLNRCAIALRREASRLFDKADHIICKSFTD